MSGSDVAAAGLFSDADSQRSSALFLTHQSSFSACPTEHQLSGLSGGNKTLFLLCVGYYTQC